MFDSLSNFMQEKEAYEFVYLNDFLPDDSRKRYTYIHNLENAGLCYPIMVLTHSSGSNLGNSHFIWKVLSTEAYFQKALL